MLFILPCKAVIFLSILAVASCFDPLQINNKNGIATLGLRRSSRLLVKPGMYIGTGAPKVDMNTYNLPMDVIVEEWTANLLTKSTRGREKGIYLGASNDREIFVDLVTSTYPRLRDQGLGIELQEIAGGRDDGLGITIITGLVPGGAAASQDIQPGDCLAKVGVVRRNRQGDGKGVGLSDSEVTISVRTECLGYDATVEAIRSLPAAASDDEVFLIEIKRLRRKPKVKVNLLYPPSQEESDTSIEMFAGENLRLGMLVRGVKLNDPLAKRFDNKNGGNCGAAGLCRTCAVIVTRGADVLNPQGLSEKQIFENSPRWRLACKAIVGYGMKEEELTIKVNPRQW